MEKWDFGFGRRQNVRIVTFIWKATPIVGKFSSFSAFTRLRSAFKLQMD